MLLAALPVLLSLAAGFRRRSKRKDFPPAGFYSGDALVHQCCLAGAGPAQHARWTIEVTENKARLAWVQENPPFL